MCVTRTSLRQRSAFLHLAIDQAWFHLPPAHAAPSSTQREPLTKVGREAITGEERQAERRPCFVGASG
jgi:hypothetical protein